MFHRHLLAGAVLASATFLGCAADPGAPSTSESAIVDELHAEPLGERLTVDDVSRAYAAQLADEVAEAMRVHPDVARVTPPGIPAFAAGRSLLRGSLTWYFRTTKASALAVAEITATLTAAVRPALEAAVGSDGYVHTPDLFGEVPIEIEYTYEGAVFSAAVREARSPAGLDLPQLLENHAAEWGRQDVILPRVVNRAPSAAELADLFSLGETPGLSGEEARLAIARELDLVTLPGLDTAPGIVERWFSRMEYGDRVEMYAFFLDEHSQLWGFHLEYAFED